MDIVWFFAGLIFLGWIMSLFENNTTTHSSSLPTNSTLTPAEKEYQRRYRIWTTQINGPGVDPNSYWGKIREEVFSRCHNCCANCGSVENLTVHHKQPLSLGGDNDLDNLILLCSDCHEAGHGRKFLNRSFEGDENYGRNHRVSKKVEILNDAIKDHKSVQIKYIDMHKVRSVRTIHPTKLRRRNRGTYVQAFCDLDNDTRIFRLSRMQILKRNGNRNLYLDEPKAFAQLEDSIVEDFKRLFS